MKTIRTISIIFVLLAALPPVFTQQRFKGYPSKEKDFDLLPGFVQPPKGYGNVPFYWWNGDSLDRQRLREQLDILSASATDGFAVSYIHYDNEVDTAEVKDGYGLFGKTEPGLPKVFSNDWWDTWQWFAGECAAKGVGLGMDDYTVGWTGNGYYPDELAAMPKFRNYPGELVFEIDSVQGGKDFTRRIPQHTIAVVAYNTTSHQCLNLSGHISDGHLSEKLPADGNYKLYTISTREGYLLHPDHGKELTRLYFDRFEHYMGDAVKDGMNYFFQDELLYPLKTGSWSEDFAAEFQKRKGYDLIPYLPALQEYIGTVTPKIRLDYCEVLLDLAEERYFQPVYDWVAGRGLIYGSDNLGRGWDPLEYVDYFRTNSWYTAPGNDAPARGSSFLPTKVSSSIAHLYERPRTWLEAFHSMGWGSSGAWLTQQMDHHVMAGGNLVCMHGLYYSTHGGWWEWAPPCFHFRMPYWPHVKNWLEYTERLSYLMSQGKHICDIALMYPTESMQAYPGADANQAFALAMTLSDAGLDYDFMDYRSLRKAVAANGNLSVANEHYKVLILADMKAMHHSSLQKALEHYRKGGIVMATGQLPQATTKSGENDSETDAMLKELFGLTATDVIAGQKASRQSNAAGGTGMYLPADDVVAQIRSLITPDFHPLAGTGKVLHRQAGKHDVYMVMDVPKGSECFFRATGKVELWNAADGTVATYPIARQTAEGTWLYLDKEPSNSYLFVFSPGSPVMEEKIKTERKLLSETLIDGDWETELLPTMDNKWGDFRFPASDGYIGAEARSFSHYPDALSRKDWMYPLAVDSRWTESVYGFGPQMHYFPIPADHPFNSSSIQAFKGSATAMDNLLEFSWQYGVYDNPGAQGWHGLKAKVSDGFLILDQGLHQLYKTQMYAPANGVYRVVTDGVPPAYLLVDGKNAGGTVQLAKGWHQLMVAYPNTRKASFEMITGPYHDSRDRSAVVFFPELSPLPEHPSSYDKTISMRWGLGDHLVYDPFGGKFPVWNYRFRSVPGLRAMEFTVAGTSLKVWFDGKPLPQKNVRLTGTKPGGIHTYQATFDEIQEKPGIVAFSVERANGYQGTAVLCEPVKLQTGKGLLAAGDWSATGALKYYSGGMYYRKQVVLQALNATGQLILDLGNVVASCELKINGQPAGILMSPPYKADITRYVKPGSNDIEVLVYSTLSNHYQTIPTPYRGDAAAGLIGPVKLTVSVASQSRVSASLCPQ